MGKGGPAGARRGIAASEEGAGHTALPTYAQLLELARLSAPADRLHILGPAPVLELIDAPSDPVDPETGLPVWACVEGMDGLEDDVLFRLHLGTRLDVTVIADRKVPHAERFFALDVADGLAALEAAHRQPACDLIRAALELAVRSTPTGLYAFAPADDRLEADLRAAGFTVIGVDADLTLDLAGFAGEAHLRAAEKLVSAQGLRLLTADAYVDELVARTVPRTIDRTWARDRVARAISALEDEVWRGIGAASRFQFRHYAATRERLNALAGRTTSLLVDSNGHIVGVSMLTDRTTSVAAQGAAEGHITALVPGWRGKGLGRALKAASCAWAKRAGVRTILMRTSADGPMFRVAIALGFVVGSREAYLERRP